MATADPRLLHAIFAFGLLNAINLLPIYPLDGGLILNALLGSFSRRLANAASWIGVLIGLGFGLYLRSPLIVLPFVLFALQRYYNGNRISPLKGVSVAGAPAWLSRSWPLSRFIQARPFTPT